MCPLLAHKESGKVPSRNIFISTWIKAFEFEQSMAPNPQNNLFAIGFDLAKLINESKIKMSQLPYTIHNPTLNSYYRILVHKVDKNI